MNNLKSTKTYTYKGILNMKDNLECEYFIDNTNLSFVLKTLYELSSTKKISISIYKIFTSPDNIRVLSNLLLNEKGILYESIDKYGIKGYFINKSNLNSVLFNNTDEELSIVIEVDNKIAENFEERTQAYGSENIYTNIK